MSGQYITRVLSVYRIASWLRVIPIVDKDAEQSRAKLLYHMKTAYSGLLTVIFVSLNTWRYFETELDNKDNLWSAKDLLSMLGAIGISLENFFIFSNSFCAVLNRKAWKSSLEHLEKYIRTSSGKKLKILHTPYTTGLHFLFTLSLLYNTYCMVFLKGDIHFHGHFMAFCFIFYYESVFIIITLSLVNIFKKQYEELRQQLANIFYEKSRKKSNEKYVMWQLKSIQLLYVDLFEIVDKFNSIFEWPLFFFFMNIGMHALHIIASVTFGKFHYKYACWLILLSVSVVS